MMYVTEIAVRMNILFYGISKAINSAVIISLSACNNTASSRPLVRLVTEHHAMLIAGKWDR
jgi:hypothetical protein